MEKYLKIHWSIRIIVSIMLFILILLIMSNIYGLIFFTGLKELLPLIGNDALENKSIPIIIVSTVLQLGFLYSIYSIFKYKRWAILVIAIFIGLPLLIIPLGGVGFIFFGLYQDGFDSIKGEEGIFFMLCISIFSILYLNIKYNMELIRLYKNLKNIDQADIQIIRNTKPKFLNLFLVSMLPVGILGILMVLLYNPVIPLDLPENYFAREDFNLNNPVYTDQKICKEFETEIGEYKDFIRVNSEDSSNSGVVLAKKVLYSGSNTYFTLTTGFRTNKKYRSYKDMMEKIQTDFSSQDYATLLLDQKNRIKSQGDLRTYILENPDQWKNDLLVLRSELTNESVLHLKKITEALPDYYRCNIRNDSNISTEFFPSMAIHFHVARLYKYAIQLAVLENDTNRAIGILKSFHTYSNKLLHSQDMSITGGMINLAILGIEFQVTENLIENSTPEQMDMIREIYTIPFDLQKNQINSWKGEYYQFEHILTGRIKSLNQISEPYLLDGKDTINRGIILVYAGAVADSQDDTTMKKKIYENQLLNNENFLTSTERSFLGEGGFTWKNNDFFAKFYNPIGKRIVETFLPSYTGFQIRYNNVKIYQDYIRFDLLGMEKK